MSFMLRPLIPNVNTNVDTKFGIQKGKNDIFDI